MKNTTGFNVFEGGVSFVYICYRDRGNSGIEFCQGITLVLPELLGVRDGSKDENSNKIFVLDSGRF